MSHDPFHDLASVLESLVDLNRRLLALCDRKRALLAAFDLDGLQVLMRSEQELSASILSFEDSASDLVARLLGPELRLRRLGRDVLLRRVILLAPKSDQARLAALRTDLLNVLAALRDSHPANLILSRPAPTRIVFQRLSASYRNAV